MFLCLAPPAGRAQKHGLPFREAAEGMGDTFHTLSQCLLSLSDLGPQLHSLGLVPASSTENFTMGPYGILGKANSGVLAFTKASVCLPLLLDQALQGQAV